MTNQNKIQISRIRTARYSQKELNYMSEDEAVTLKLYGRTKAIKEERIETLTVQDLNELRTKVLELCRKNPAPIIIKMGNNLKDSFIVNKKYDQRDPEGIFEIIFYSYFAERKNERRNTKDPVDPYSNIEAAPKAIGPSGDKLRMDRIAEAQEEFGRRIRKNIEKFPLRPPVPASRPIYMPDRGVEVICRIVGKGWENVFAHKGYYQALNLIDGPVQYIDNTLNEMSHKGEYQVREYQLR